MNLDLAERLLAAGIPVVVVGPGDRVRQKGWSGLTAEECDLKLYRSGDALALVGGHGIDVVDVDVKDGKGGSVEHLPSFKSFGMTRTPSGGEHHIVPSTGIGTIRGLRTDAGFVGDYVGGWPDGEGRLLAYLPGSARTKYPDGGYVEEVPWDVEGCLAADPDADLFAALLAAKGDRHQSEPYMDTSQVRPASDGVHPYAEAGIRRELARLDACDILGWLGEGWDNTTFAVACNLIEIANSNWSGYSLDDAERDLLDNAPTDEEFGPASHEDKWQSALVRVGDGGRPPPGITPQDEFTAEPEVEPEEVEPVDAFAREVAKAAHRLRVQEAARDAVAADRVGGLDLPDLTRLDEFLSDPDEEVTHRVADLWPSGGRVVLAAQHKAGKTTLTGNLTRSLVDGEPFLGRFDPITAGRVLLLDNEMDARMMRRWLRDQDIRATDAVELVSLRGRLSAFDVVDKATRSRWARHLGEADVVILDCLRPALDALGLSEDKDAGRFLEAMDELLVEAGIGELLVVHHMGHTNERSRGDSRILDWPDAVWNLVREDTDDPMSPRYFKAYGRDVDQPEVRLAFNPLDRRLQIDGGSRRDVKSSGMQEEITAFVEDNPGCSQTAIENATKGDRGLIRKAIKGLVSDELLLIQKEGNAHHHFPA